MTFFVAAALFIISLLATFSFFYYGYHLSHSAITGDMSFFDKRAATSEIAPIIPVEPVVFDKEILKSVSGLRSEIERLAAENPNGDAATRGLIERVENIEKMIALKPEEVASLAVIAQRVAGLENELQRTEARMQNQINNLNTLSLGLFGALLVAVLGSAIWRNISLRKME